MPPFPLNKLLIYCLYYQEGKQSSGVLKQDFVCCW